MFKIFTKVLKIDENNIDFNKIKEAAEVIKNGGLVCFPTETVYGIGANAFDENAVAKIFKAKGRPSDNPLIVHIESFDDIYNLAKEVPKKAEILADKFWPGPLTIILQKKDIVPKITTAGLDTVAIRMPKNKIARAIIKEAGVPIAAPSANISGLPSGTSFKYCYDDLFSKVDIIIDGGICEVGLESTVINISDDKNIILRPGHITKAQLEKALPNVFLDEHLESLNSKVKTPLSPGMKYKHYSPNADLFIVLGNFDKATYKINELCKNHNLNNEKCGVLCFDQYKEKLLCDNIFSLGNVDDLSYCAKHLFENLRKADDRGIKFLYSFDIPKNDLGFAISNRLYKAAGNKIIRV